MTTRSIGPWQEAFRAAIQTGDFARAEAALHEYIGWFESAGRTPEEAACARDLFAWGVGAVKIRAAQLAEELTRITKVMDGYGPARRTHTWRLDG
jgi:hypothetical protein